MSENKSKIKQEIYREFDKDINSKEFSVTLGNKLFDILKENSFDPDKIINGPYSKYLVFGVPSYYINKYLTEKLKLTGIDYIVMSGYANKLERALDEKRKKLLFDFYDKILKTSNKEIIINLVSGISDNVFTDINMVLNSVMEYMFANNLDIENKDNIVEDIIKKIDIYKDYKKNNEDKFVKVEKIFDENDKNLLEDAKKMVISYINSYYDNRNDFCNDRNIKLADFDRMLYLIKNCDNEFYLWYENSIRDRRNAQLEMKQEMFKSILNGICYGVIEDDNIRSYDLLDYSLMTNLSLDDFQELCKLCDIKGERLRKVRAFVSKNINVGSKKVKTVLEEKLVIANKEVSNKEKEYVINYLKKNHIPFNEKVYMIALRRYLNKKLENYQNNTKEISSKNNLRN